MKKTAILFLSASCLLLSNGCATIVEGNDQVVYFDSNPSGATCSISRSGEGVLYPKFLTPASLEIEKDKDQMTIICNKEGYKETIIYTDSNFEGMTLGNLLFGGVVGIGVDAASGALNKYPDQVVIPLNKE